jgi:Domain of unknown function (DUF4145)
VFHFQLKGHKESNEFDHVKGNLLTNGIRTLSSWPRKVEGDVPADCPPQIESLFVQAVNCIRQGSWDAAGMTFRKVVDVSTKLLDPSLSVQNLAKRIDELESRGKLTSDIRDWAHEVRLDGNEAAHEDEPFSREQAESLNVFVEAYLRYIYTLPSLVAKSRRSRQSVEAA